MLFVGGVITGIMLSVVIVVVGLLLWKKLFKSKFDEMMFRAELKAIETKKEKDK